MYLYSWFSFVEYMPKYRVFIIPGPCLLFNSIMLSDAIVGTW